LPCFALICLDLPCFALLCLELPCFALLCLALPCFALLCLDLPCFLFYVRLFIVIFCYQSGKNNMIWLALKSRQMRSGVEHPESYLENFKRDNFAVIEGS
jgi:hypothetical protein